MPSENGDFWDQRYDREGPIWGWEPSPTAQAACRRLAPGARVLDVGFGYGRDIAHYLRQGYGAAGIDLSHRGRQLADELLRAQGLKTPDLWTGRFEDSAIPAATFDAVCCHRMIHLLLDDAAVQRFVERVAAVLRPGGLVCVAARNVDDLDPEQMKPCGCGVYEYRNRPGHQIRYWDDPAFHAAFDDRFTVIDLTAHVEAESRQRPTPCHLSVLVGQLREVPAP